MFFFVDIIFLKETSKLSEDGRKNVFEYDRDLI